MNADRLRQISAIYEAAVVRTAADRASYLAQVWSAMVLAANGEDISMGNPTLFFEIAGPTPEYMIAPDENRFFVLTTREPENTAPIHVILNWAAQR